MLITYKNPSVIDLQVRQKGITLIIVFFTMTILLATLLSISTILYNEVKVISNASNAVSSFYASNSGIEKTLYYARKQIPAGGYTGICNICNACNSSDCQSCTTTPLAISGCDLTTCSNCQITYQSSFNNRTYLINATISPDANPAYSLLNISSKGIYNSTARNLSVTQKIEIPSNNGIVRVQNGNMGQHRGTTASFSWPVATTPGNTLIIIASVTNNQGQTISSPITPPSGWSSAVSYTGNSVTTSIFYKAGAASEGVTGNFTSPISSNRTEWAIIGIEYSGILSPSPLDKVASQGILSTTVTTGTTATTTQADELWIAGIGNESNTVSSPTNGFSIVATNNSFMGLTALEKNVSSIGQASTGGTVANGESSGVIATFKAGPSSPPPPTGPELVQKGKNTGLSSVSVTWPLPTTTGNLLIAVVTNRKNTGSPLNVNAPSGWTRAVTASYTSLGGPRTSIFYRQNAPSQISTGNFTASGTGSSISIVVAEYSGIMTSNSLDRTASLGNQNTITPTTGTTATTTQSSELIIGSIASWGGTATNPTNGFSIVDQINTGQSGAAILLQKIVSSTGTYESSVTTIIAHQSAGSIATFKASP